MTEAGARRGLLLANLGTPAAAAVRDVRRYLREFLSDPLVIDLPTPLRQALVHLVIAPFRAPRSARAYASIWTPAGSPLLLHSRALAEAVRAALGPGFRVELGMRYGAPAIPEALDRLAASGVERVLAVPLFPQQAASSSGSALAKVREWSRGRPGSPPVETRGAFFADPGFLDAQAAVVGEALRGFDADHLLFSFHGLPERHVRRADATGGHCLAGEDCCDAPGDALRTCYRAQCFATARALAERLGQGRTSVAFQSRLGRAPWIRPYLDDALVELAGRGVRRLAVACPSFVADCLETLEEIGLRARERWRALGGEGFRLAPCVNAHPTWVETVAGWARSRP